MPGPTTEVLNEDIRELKGDLRGLRSTLDTLKSDVHTIALAVAKLDDVRSELAGVKATVQATAVDLAEFKGQVRAELGVARWAGVTLVGLMLSGGVGAVWWAARATERAENLNFQVQQLAVSISKMNAAPEQQRLYGDPLRPAPIAPTPTPTPNPAPKGE